MVLSPFSSQKFTTIIPYYLYLCVIYFFEHEKKMWDESLQKEFWTKKFPGLMCSSFNLSLSLPSIPTGDTKQCSGWSLTIILHKLFIMHIFISWKCNCPTYFAKYFVAHCSHVTQKRLITA